MKIKYYIFPLLVIFISSCNGNNSAPSTSSITSNLPSITSESSEHSSSLSEISSATSNYSQDSFSRLAMGTTTVLSEMKTINQYQKQTHSASGMPSIGNIDVLVIPVEIKGIAFPNNYKTNIELLFNGTSAATGWESVSSYYTASSYGSVNYNFEITNKYITNNNKAYFEGKGEEGDQYAIAEILAQVSDVDFSKYDYNNDGLLDSVIFIYSATFNYDKDPWWAWVYSGQFFNKVTTPKKGSLELGYYMWASYEFMFEKALAVAATVNAETYIHEFGHLLGMPDYYPTTSSNYGPLGGWDMMDMNAGDHGPFNKLMLGWISPLVAPLGYQYEISLDSYSLDDDGRDVAILIPRSNANFTDGDAFDEYLLVIYYTPNGLYRGHMGTKASISEAGVAIYHVDARLSPKADEWEFFLNNNDGTSNFLVSILEADKNNSIPSRIKTINKNDILLGGSIDLSSYLWNQGGTINTKIAIETKSESSAKLNIEVR